MRNHEDRGTAKTFPHTPAGQNGEVLRVLAFPDLHSPFVNAQAVDFLKRVSRDVRPQQVICLGDEVDSYGLSRFSKDPDLDNPGRELQRARDALQPFFDLFPRVKVCNSNHTQRGLKRAQEAGLPGAYLKPTSDVLGAPRGWTWADEWEIDDVLYMHGEGFSGIRGATDAAIAHRQSVVIGHLHAHAGITWIGSRAGLIFGMNAGCLIDPSAPAFSYAKHSRHRPVLGCAFIEDGLYPRFIPLH